MNNQIQNQKTEVPTGIKLNDKDYLNSLLSCLKEMVRNYAVVLTEVSNEELYSTYKNIFDEISRLQRDVFEILFRKGWYVLEAADSNKINSKYSTLNQEYNDLNLND